MRLIILLICLICTYPLCAEEKIIIAFSPENCSNCNTVLPYISRDTNLSMTYVMRKRYAKDEKILKEKYLKNFKIDTIIYSDEMYKHYADHRGTTVSNETKTYSKNVRDITDQDIDFIEKYIALSANNKPNVSYLPEHFEANYQFGTDGRLYYFNHLYNTISSKH